MGRERGEEEETEGGARRKVDERKRRALNLAFGVAGGAGLGPASVTPQISS